MANSELRAAARTFYREKSYALINLSGLSLAIACCIILGLYLRNELTYDRHNERYKQIFRIVQEWTANGTPNTWASTSVALGPMLKQTYPEIVEDYVRLSAAADSKILIRSDDRMFYWDRVYYADENLFDIFTHHFIYGDQETAMKDPSSAVVSETFARKYFGDSNPIGKTIQADIAPVRPRKITAVFRDLPENTHLKNDEIFRFPNIPPGATYNRRQLINNGFFTRQIFALA